MPRSPPPASARRLPWQGIWAVSYTHLDVYKRQEQKVQVIKYDLRSAMQYVNQQRSRDDLLILQIPHQEWAYRYYTSDFGPHPFQDLSLIHI